MEQTFMTIHNLTPEANILFASESIYDILGYHPHDVQDRSCFDYFHPDEVPFAKSIHTRGVLLDKAAVLHYARIRSRDGQWVSCECCFTVVHDVLVACTSIYRRGEKSDRRALEAPQIRRLFSCSPRDPRYHMLEYLSPKFRMDAPAEREPRAALIINRFTRTHTIMFATNAVSSILGLPADVIKGKSFYECIQENCLADAIRCLESAKANDSIAYLRFWYRDPRRPQDFPDEAMDDDGGAGGVDGQRRRRNGARESTHSSDSEGGGAQLYGQMDVDGHSPSPHIKVEEGEEGLQAHPNPAYGSSSANPLAPESGSSSGHVQTPASPPLRRDSPSPAPEQGPRELLPTVELEAVVSCTSDGLVVVLRKARPAIPSDQPPAVAPRTYANGLFAAPWGHHPVENPSPAFQHAPHQFGAPAVHGQASLQNGLVPQYAAGQDVGGPPLDQLMRSIREVAVFAWALVGINGNLANYSRGNPRDEARPVGGLPIWDPAADGNHRWDGPENQAVKRWAAYDRGKRAAPDVFTGPYQLGRFKRQYQQHHQDQQQQQQLVDSGYSTQGSTLAEQYSFAEPPSVRHAWSRYRQRQQQQQQQQQSFQLPAPPNPSAGGFDMPPSYEFGSGMPFPPAQPGALQYHPPSRQNDYQDQRPRYEPEYQGQPWTQDPNQAPTEGSGHFDVASHRNGHNGQFQGNRFPWN